MEYKSKIPEITLKYKTGSIVKTKITQSNDAANAFRQMFDSDTLEIQESFIVLFLNKANNTIGWFKLSQGGIAGTVADPKLIFATALKCGASAIIVAHNHPSGNINPSDNDIQLTKKIKSAGGFLDITLLDSMILTTDDYFSFADEGLI